MIGIFRIEFDVGDFDALFADNGTLMRFGIAELVVRENDHFDGKPNALINLIESFDASLTCQFAVDPRRAPSKRTGR